MGAPRVLESTLVRPDLRAVSLSSGCLKPLHPLDVQCQTHQVPLALDLVQAAQAESAETEHLLDPPVRDRHIAQIRSNGRMAWQVATGYNQRSRIETQIGRWKGVIGRRLQSRSFSRQITEIPGRPESPEHNDRTRTACVRTYRLTLRLGERGNSISAPIHATTLLSSLRPIGMLPITAGPPGAGDNIGLRIEP